MDVVREWREWAQLQYSPRTVKTYEWFIRRFVEEYGVTENVSDIVEFINEFDNPTTRMVAAHAVISLYEFLGRSDIASRIPKPRGSSNPPDILTFDYSRLRRAIMMLPDVRERAILCVAYEAALRSLEVTLLRRSDFDPDTCRLRVWRVKRPQGRPEPMEPGIILPRYCCEELKRYMATRRDRNPALFLNAAGQPLKPHNARYVFRKLAVLLGKPEARFHQLRHTAITERAESLDLAATAKYAGHRNPASTLVYIHYALENLMKRLKPSERRRLLRELTEQLKRMSYGQYVVKD